MINMKTNTYRNAHLTTSNQIIQGQKAVKDTVKTPSELLKLIDLIWAWDDGRGSIPGWMDSPVTQLHW